jgi:hypothetical protein
MNIITLSLVQKDQAMDVDVFDMKAIIRSIPGSLHQGFSQNSFLLLATALMC